MDDWRSRHEERLAAGDWDGLVELYRARLGDWDQARWDACIPDLQATYARLEAGQAAQLDARLSWLCFEATGGDETLAEAWGERVMEGVDIDHASIDHEDLRAAQTWQLARRYEWAAAQGHPEEELAELLRHRLLVADRLSALTEPLRALMELLERAARQQLEQHRARASEVEDERAATYLEGERRAFEQYTAGMARRTAAAIALIEGEGLDAYSFEERVHATCLLLGRSYRNACAGNNLIARALEPLVLPDDDDPLFARYWGAGAAFMALVFRATTPSRREVIRELGVHAGSDSDEVTVTCVAGRDDPEATGNERALLASACAPLPLARVHFPRGRQYGSFTLGVDGRVKWLGKLKLSLDWRENVLIYCGAARGRGAGFVRPEGAADDEAVTAWARFIAERVSPEHVSASG